MKFFKPTVMGLGLFCILACNRESDEASGIKNISQKDEENKFYAPAGNANTDTAFKSGQQQLQPSSKNETKIDWDKKIIKTATLSLEIKDYRLFNQQVRENIKRYGGYIAQEEQNQTDYKIENSVTIKVPVDQFDDLVTALTKGEEKINEKKISSEDVTTEVVDTKSRLEAKKQVRLRYLDLLKQARNMEEILNVQNEINRIQEDIEAAAGRIEYLSHSSAFSTISLTYFQVVNASAKDNGEISYGTKVWQSFKNGWSWVGEVFVGIISIWPLFLLAFVCWFAYKKWLSSKTQKRNA